MRRRLPQILVALLILIVALGAILLIARRQKPVFAVVPRTINDPYYGEVRAACIDEAQKLGVTCEFTGPATIDAAAQVAILEGLIQRRRRVAGLAINPVDAKSVQQVMKQAVEAGIPVITFDADAPAGSGRVAFVGTDDETAGIELARLVIKLAPQGATYAIITGHLDSRDLNERIKGVRKQLSGQGTYAKGPGEYKEVKGSPFATNGEISRAVRVVQEVIRANANLTAIVMVANWPLLDPEGYKKALDGKARSVQAGKFVVVSFDMLEPQLKLLKEGFVSGLIGQRPDYMGRQSIRVLHELAVKKGLVSTFHHSGIRIITKENVDFFIR